MPSVEVSWGEVADRATILELKCARIRDPAKAAFARAELAGLPALPTLVPESWARELGECVRTLRAVNAALWDVEDGLRAMDPPGGVLGDDALATRAFVAAARSVYRTNDARAATKARIDAILGSRVREVKGHPGSAAAPAASPAHAGQPLVLGHLGLGDQLVCYGLVSELARRHGRAFLVARRAHRDTLRRLYAGDAVDFVWVDSDADLSPRFGADPARLAVLRDAGLAVVALGVHAGDGGRPFWHAFYDRAGVERSECLRAFRRRVAAMGDGGGAARVPPPDGPYAVVHEDPARGLVLDRSRVDEWGRLPVVVVGGAGDDVLGYLDLLRGCDAFHGFDSSFAWLVQLAGVLPWGRKVMHAYVKGDYGAAELYPAAPGESPWVDLR